MLPAMEARHNKCLNSLFNFQIVKLMDYMYVIQSLDTIVYMR